MPIVDDSTTTGLVAYVVGGREALLSAEELDNLKASLKSKLPEYATPTHWVVLEALPTKGGESRKLDRQVRRATPAGQLAHISGESPL